MKQIAQLVILSSLTAVLSGCVFVKAKGPGWSMTGASLLSDIGNANATFNTNSPGTGSFSVNNLTPDQQSIQTLSAALVTLASKAPTNAPAAANPTSK